MNIDFKNRDSGSRLIGVAFALAILSMLMPWVSLGILSQNGIEQGAVLVLILWEYPVLRVAQTKVDAKFASITLSLISLLATVAYGLSKATVVFGERMNLSGSGVYLFGVASVLLGVGAVIRNRDGLSKPSQPTTEAPMESASLVAETSATTESTPTAPATPAAQTNVPTPLTQKPRKMLGAGIVALAVAGIAIVFVIKSRSTTPTPMDVCKMVAATGEADECKAEQPGGLGHRAKESVTFKFKHVAIDGERKGGQILSFETDETLAATVKDFEDMALLAGPHRYHSKSAKIFLQANSETPPELGRKLKKIVEGLGGPSGQVSPTPASKTEAGGKPGNPACPNLSVEMLAGTWSSQADGHEVITNLSRDGRFVAVNMHASKKLSGSWKLGDGAITWTYDPEPGKPDTNAILECSKEKLVVKEADGSSTTYTATLQGR